MMAMMMMIIIIIITIIRIIMLMKMTPAMMVMMMMMMIMMMMLISAGLSTFSELFVCSFVPSRSVETVVDCGRQRSRENQDFPGAPHADPAISAADPEDWRG